MSVVRRATRRELLGWAMFDFANSSYTTVIITIVFCNIFTSIIVGDGPEFRYGNYLWTVALSLSYFIVLLTSPLLGAVMDFTGSKKTFILTLILWIITIILIYGTNDVTDFINSMGTSFRSEHIFLIIGSIAGLGLGSTQSACRAMVGLFSPDTKAGEFFGLWNLSNRLAAIIGLMAVGMLQAALGLQIAVLICSIFFIIALVIVVFVNEERGKTAAREHAGE